MEKEVVLFTGNETMKKIQVVRPAKIGEVGDTLAIQEAFQQAIDTQSAAVFFPAREQAYTLSETIHLEGMAHLKIYGEGMGKSSIKQTSNGPLFKITSSSDTKEWSRNICFEGLTMQQEKATNDPNQACIYMEYATEVSFNQMKFLDATSALMVRHSSFLSLNECIMQNMRVSHMNLMEGTRDVMLSTVSMDTCGTTPVERHALLHIGSPIDPDQTVKNVSIDKCRFRNNTSGKGIEAQSVINLLVSNNLIENCSTGILIGREDKIELKIPSQTIKIIQNTIIQGKATIGYSGILVKGGQESSQVTVGTALGTTIFVVGNKVTGFGNEGDANPGGIVLQWAEQVIVQNNIVNEATRTAFGMKYIVTSQVSNNQFLNTVKSSKIATTVPVFFGMGCYSIDFYRNKLVNNRFPGLTYGVYNKGGRGMVNYFENTILSTNENYQVENGSMNGVLNKFKLGIAGWSKVTTQEGKIVQVCTTNNGLVIRSDGEKIGMAASGEKPAQSDGLTGELEFNETILDHLSLNEEFELEIDGNKVLFTLLKLKNGKIGIVAPEIPVSFTGAPVQRMGSEWKAY